MKTKPIVFDNEGKTFNRYSIITPDGEIYGAGDSPFTTNEFGQYSGDVLECADMLGFTGAVTTRQRMSKLIKAYADEARSNSEWLGKEITDFTLLPHPVQQYIKQIIKNGTV